jgi:hypothetical protein
MGRSQGGRQSTHLVQELLQLRNHVLLDDDALLVQVLDNVLVVVFAVDRHDDGLDRRVALDQDAWRGERG